MPTLTRRTFLGTATAATGALLAPRGFARRPADTVRLAVIGLRGRGSQLLGGLERLDGVAVTMLCDVDQQVLDRELGKREGRGIVGVRDLRRVFDSDDVDAVVIATPNHWHALATIWAVQAGKDVYVEKPISWTVAEGRRMVEAASAHGRVVAAGFQNRSDTGLRAFMERLHAGEWGAIQNVRGLCYRKRAGIGARLAEHQPPPAHVDYDLWLGPADDLPITRPSFHYDWHWIWNTGNGDFGNQGPHELDLMRWALGDPELPTGVATFGGRFGWDDAGETPNMHGATFHGLAAPAQFEVRDLARARAGEGADKGVSFKGTGVGILVTCEAGEFRGGRGGGKVFAPDGEVLAEFPGDKGATHLANFVDCVRAGDPGGLRVDLESAHRSTALAHLANLSYRCGASGSTEEVAARHAGDARWTEMVERFAGHLAAWDVDLQQTPWTLGADLEFDPQGERFTGGERAADANGLLTRAYREGFRVPQRI